MNSGCICASIELSFGRLKSNAFNLEDAHMAAPAKMPLLTIGAANTPRSAQISPLGGLVFNFLAHTDWMLCESFSALLTRHTFQTATKTATISAPRRFP
jgi:hypothetical protein